MTNENTDSFLEQTVDRLGMMLAVNSDRIFIVMGFLLLYLHAVTLLAGSYANSVFCGFLGWHCLGGWPALRRLCRHPIIQLRHWYHVLRGTLKIEYREYPDGNTRVSIMKASRHNGWCWTEVRPRKIKSND